MVGAAEPSVIVAASAPHRAEAFAGCRELIDELKATVPIWKKERGRRRPVGGGSPMPEMVDSFGRVVRDLRVSVTDKCNFRCLYCMPEDGLPWLAKDDVLGRDELIRALRVAIDLGCGRSASPAASRPCAATWSTWSPPWARSGSSCPSPPTAS